MLLKIESLTYLFVTFYLSNILLCNFLTLCCSFLWLFHFFLVMYNYSIHKRKHMINLSKLVLLSDPRRKPPSPAIQYYWFAALGTIWGNSRLETPSSRLWGLVPSSLVNSGFSCWVRMICVHNQTYWHKRSTNILQLPVKKRKILILPENEAISAGREGGRARDLKSANG